MILRTAFLLAFTVAALALVGCNQCDDPTAPNPGSDVPELMYNQYIPGLSSHIYTSRADGTSQRPWATTSGYITTTGLIMSSPRNGKVAFISGGKGLPSSLIVADLNGANAVVLESNAEFGQILYPVISPDGRKVVVNRIGTAPSADVVVYDVATRTKQVIANDMQRESEVRFTPTTGEIAYYTADNKINLIRTDGTGKRTVVTDAYRNNDYSCFLDFSPNGDRMVYMRTTAEPRGSRLGIYSFATNTTTAFAEDSGTAYAFPAWSPDGATIAYVRGTKGDDKVVLVTAPASGAGPERVILNVDNNYPQFPQWSGNSRYLSATITVGEAIDDGTFTVRVFDQSTGTSTLIGTDLMFSYWVK